MNSFMSSVWGKLLGVLLGAAIIGIFTGSVQHVLASWAVEARVVLLESEGEASKKRDEKLQKTLDDVASVLKSMQQQQEEFKGLILTPTVTGRATIGNFGVDSAFVDINEYGNAKMYLGSREVEITCAVNGVVHVVVFEVRGVIQESAGPRAFDHVLEKGSG